MKLTRPFIRLPFCFDAQRLKHELEQFVDSDWMAHPSNLAGNFAIPLISKQGERNNDFEGHMLATQALRRCEYIQQVMGSFNEVLARSRLMRLDAGAEVSEHVDFNYHWYSRVRIHIPITTTPDVMFHCGHEAIHMRQGECWIFDSWRRHKVVNSGSHTRVHLVIDTAGSSRFWRTVREMEAFGSSLEDPTLQKRIIPHRYVEGLEVSLKTERYNIAPVMAPGELEAIADELITDFKNHPENDPHLVVHYQQILQDLAKDWRETWHLFGYEQAGWPAYRSLLSRTAKQLHPNPRALVSESNQVGINPIIMQRLIHAALNVEHLDAFIKRHS